MLPILLPTRKMPIWTIRVDKTTSYENSCLVFEHQKSRKHSCAMSAAEPEFGLLADWKGMNVAKLNALMWDCDGSGCRDSSTFNVYLTGEKEKMSPGKSVPCRSQISDVENYDE